MSYTQPDSKVVDSIVSSSAPSRGQNPTVVRVLHPDNLPSTSNLYVHIPCSPLTLSPPRQRFSVTADVGYPPLSPLPPISPVICMSHQRPTFPVLTVGSLPKEFGYPYGACPGSPTQHTVSSSTSCHAHPGPSSLLLQTGSCILLPTADEKTPLLRNAIRPELSSPTGTSNGIQEAPSQRQKFRFSRKQILTLASMLLVDFTSFASMSILAPFLPEQVKRLNMGPTLDGIIFSVYALIIVVSSPIIGKLLPVMNSRKVYLCGILLAAVANICFGMVQYVTTPELFVVVAVCLRIASALGAAAFLTVIYSVVPILFPADMNMVNGMMETAVGIGMCVGPAVGVWLFSIGGFSLPFYGLGCFIILAAFINYITFPNDEIGLVPLNESGGVMKVLCRAEAILPLVILFVTATSLALLYPTLQPHMSKLGVSVEGVGLVFLLMSAVYAVSSPLVGLATDRFNCPWGFMSSGLVIMAVALVLLGNSPLLPHLPHKELYNQDVIAIVFLGLSSAMAIVPTYAALLQSAARESVEVDLATYAVVGGLWSSSYSLGEMLGPLLAGVMTEYITFAMSTTVVAILPAALAVICGAFMCVERHRSRKASES